MAEDQASARYGDVPFQRGQALQHEGRDRSAGVRSRKKGRVEDKERNDRIRFNRGGPKGCVIAQS